MYKQVIQCNTPSTTYTFTRLKKCNKTYNGYDINIGSGKCVCCSQDFFIKWKIYCVFVILKCESLMYLWYSEIYARAQSNKIVLIYFKHMHSFNVKICLWLTLSYSLVLSLFLTLLLCFSLSFSLPLSLFLSCSCSFFLSFSISLFLYHSLL